MPGPPPPPPPGCPPPPMPTMSFTPSKGGKGGADERSALLNAIKKQPKLNRVDKSLINDRSAPLASGGNKSNSVGVGGGGGGAASTHSYSGGGGNIGPPNGGLGGLFQGGMPKLKSVNRNNGPETPPSSIVSNNSGSSFGGIQEELKKRLNNDSKNTNRGPAPPAPTRNITNELSSLQSKNGYQINHNKTNSSSHVHRKTQSNGNFNTNHEPTPPPTTTHSFRNNNHTPAKQSFGKPNLAPKPPVLEKPLSNGKLRKSHSVRLPSSPLSPAVYGDTGSNPLSLGHHLDMEKSRTLGGSTGQLSPFKFRPVNGRPTVPPPSIPTKVKPPNHAPPPPPSATNTLPQAPSHAPPPPPHRSVPPVPTRAPPAVPTYLPNAPAPPPRNSSIRPVNGVPFESRFNFHPQSDFPPPQPFRNVPKVYLGRQAGKQQAPQPPSNNQIHQQQMQLAGSNRLWESSTC